MSTLRTFVLLPLVLLLGADAPMTPLFNGKDLSGWVPNPYWKVVDGVLVGESDGTDAKDLNTQKSYKEFEFETEVRYGPEGDSGVNFRTPMVQVQIGFSTHLKVDKTGSVYDESTGGGYIGDAKYPETLLKKGDWNTIRFVAKGDTVTTYLNGQKLLEQNIAKWNAPGPIGLQLHAGKANKIEYRNMKVREL